MPVDIVSIVDPNRQRQELDTQRRRVDFDSYDITVDELLRRVQRERVDVAPSYQRKFRWDNDRQSTLIESIYLGIPVPPLFMATSGDPNETVRWEVVDGLQRVTTLVSFAGEPEARRAVKLPADESLKLSGLEKLQSLNGCTFLDLPPDIRSKFEDRPLKVIVLNDKSELRVRFDLFERLNTGGIRLTHQEVRECVFRGAFVDLVTHLAENEIFREVVKVSPNQRMDGTYQEYVLRFFAYLNKYREFEHSVKGFLDDYCSEMAAKDVEVAVEDLQAEFLRTFDFLSRCFPTGIHGAKRSTPVNLYEGIAVGAALALRVRSDLEPLAEIDWSGDPELKKYIYGATNTRTRVIGRIEHCRDVFLAQ